MKIKYDDIELKIATIDIDRRVVWTPDGSGDYLYTQWDIDCTCLAASASPQFYQADQSVGMSWVRTGGGGIAESLNSNPINTDAAIRHRLSMPRKTLVLEADGFELLKTPAEGMPCDAANGPFPKVFPIPMIFGNARTFGYNWQRTTFINECGGNGSSEPPALLSNKFSQRHVYNEDYFLTIETEGIAHFRTDVLRKNKLNPDLLRPMLVLPIPLGMKREIMEYANDPSGNVFYYKFSDRQMATQFVAGDEIGATRAEIFYEQALVTDQDVINGILGGVEKAQQIQWYAEQNKSREPSERVGKGPNDPHSNKPFHPPRTSPNSRAYGSPRKRNS